MSKRIFWLKKIELAGLFLIFIFGLVSPGQAQSLRLPLLWKTNLNMLLETAPTVADVNGDGRAEILVAGMEKLFVLNGKGQVNWAWATRKRFTTYPAVLPRSGQPALIYVADNSGLFTCLDGTGNVVWQMELNGPASWSAAAVVSDSPDGIPRVVQADQSGTIWCLNALTGQTFWKKQISGKPSSPALGDLDGDGVPEIVYKTTDGTLAALSLSGKILWYEKIGGDCADWANASPVIFAASDGRARVAAASSDGELFVTDGTGQILWTYPTGQPVASTISVADFDRDGLADIFFVTQLGVVFRLDETGRVLWQIDMQGRSLAPGALLDVNNDGQMEYILCTQRGHFMVFNQAGQIIYDYQFDNRTINVTPTFGDVARKRSRLEFAITGGESGQVFCFGSPAYSRTKIAWPAYRANSQNTGSWFGLSQSKTLRMIPQNLAWDRLLVGQPVRFSVWNPNPAREPLKATAVCEHPDGKRQSAVGWILGRRGELVLPVDFVSPGTYRFSWRLETRSGKRLLSGEKSVTCQPFANDRALVARAIEKLRRTAKIVSDTLPLTAEALRAQAEALQTATDKLAPRQQAVPASSQAKIQAVLSETARLNQKAQRALGLSRVALKAQALGSGTSLLAFEGTFWENRGVNWQLPVAAANPVKITHTVVPGEHQPVPLVVFNVTNRPLSARLRLNSVDKGLRVTLRHSVPTPTNLGEISWDPLPKVDASGVVRIPPLESREFWLDVRIDPGAKGGQEIDLEVLALNGAGVLEAPHNPHTVPAPKTRVQITFYVLPFRMAPSGDFRLCTWSPSSGPALPDLLAHGNNVFLLPQPKFTKSVEKPSGSWDFSALDSLLKKFARRDVFFLLSDFPAVPGKFGSSEYRENLRDYVKVLVSHFKEKQIDVEHFALYPIDEPAGHGWKAVRKLVSFGTMIHAVNPKVKIYMDGDGKIPMLKEMARCVDIWTPPIDWLGDDGPGMRLIRKTHKTLWSYNCSYSFSRPIGANLKNTNLIAEYRGAALFALRHGATGIGYWCYNATPGDLWERTTPEYNLVYPGQNGPVTSRRWEAVREGIEDARILMALKSFRQKNMTNPEKKEICAKIQDLLENDLPALVDPGFQAMKLGLSRRALDMASNEQKMRRFRAKMMACVREVTQGH